MNSESNLKITPGWEAEGIPKTEKEVYYKATYPEPGSLIWQVYDKETDKPIKGVWGFTIRDAINKIEQAPRPPGVTYKLANSPE